MKLAYSFLVVFLMFFLVSCAKGLEKNILGKWQETDGLEIVEFLKDGTLKISRDGMLSLASYQFMNEKYINIKFNTWEGEDSKPYTARIEIRENELVLFKREEEKKYIRLQIQKKKADL